MEERSNNKIVGEGTLGLILSVGKAENFLESFELKIWIQSQ